MIWNKTQNRKIVNNSRQTSSVLLKAKGLMFSRPLRDSGLVFCFSGEALRPIHMLFVFFPIDVLFLDRNKRVVEIKHNLRPFLMCFPRKKSQYIIELPKGSADGCCIGDMIRFNS